MANSSSAQNVQLNLKINGTDAFNTLKDLNAHLSATKGKIIKMNRDDPNYDHVSKHLRDLIEKQKAWTKEIYNTQKEAKNFFDKFKSGLAGIAGAVSVGSLISSGIQSAMGYVNSFFANAQAASTLGEQMQAQLAMAIKSTGGAAGITRDRLNELSAALMKQTGISKGAIAQSQALLLTFTEIGGEIYDQTLPLILDMSKAFGQDLHTSTIQVGKALNDPILGLTALRKIGVSFSESQSQVIHKLQKTGDLVGAQKVILKELAREFGGVAEAVSNTNSGQLESFNTRIAAIQGSIGRLITAFKAAHLNALEPFVRLLEKITSSNMPAKLQEEQTELKHLVGAISMTNTNQDVRNQLISELQGKYPDFLGNIKKEDASNELLARRLQAVNNQYREKIFMAANEEKIQELQERKNKVLKEEAKARIEIAKASKLSAEELAKLDDKEIENLGRKQQREALNKKLKSSRFVSEGSMRETNRMELILNARKHILEIDKKIGVLTNANAIYTNKIQKDQIKGIDDEIVKLKELEAEKIKASRTAKEKAEEKEKFDSEIARLEGKKNTLLGISTKQITTKDGPTEEEKKKAAELKAIRKKALHDLEELNDGFKDLQIKEFEDSLAADQKEIQQKKNKYEALIQEREKYLKNPHLSKEQKSEVKEQISTLKTDRHHSVGKIEVRQEKERIAQITELRAQFHVVKEREIEKEINLINKKYARLKEDAKGNAKAIEMLESHQATDLANAKIREEQRFQNEKKALQDSGLTNTLSKEEQERANIKQKYDAKIETLKEHFSEELQLTEDFKNKLAELEAAKNKEIAHKTQAAKAEEAKKVKDTICTITQDTANAVFSIMSNNRQAETQEHISEINKQRAAELANKDLTEEQKKAINAKYDKQIAAEKLRAWQADKNANLGQAVINGALAVIKVLHNPIQAALTGVAAAAQIAVIDAQKPPKFAKGGQLPQGPTHANGGISLIAPNGQKVGEIEGGEPILSRETYANNRQLIDALLYSSQRLNGTSIRMNTHEAIRAERMFRYGGLAPTTVNNTNQTVHNSSVDLSILIHELRALQLAVREEKTRPVEFNYRVFEAYRDRIDGIRAGVDA
jgi:hypothetical protein